MRTLNIGVFYDNNSKYPIELEETALLLSSRNIVPNVGDHLAIVGKDNGLINDDAEHILTVTKRQLLFNKWDILITVQQ